VIDMPAEVSTVSIADPRVADAAVGSERTVVINGKATGVTSLVVWESGGRHTLYQVTVVDYTQAQRILTEKAKSCPAGAEPCLGGPGDEGHWKADIRGAMDYATWQILKRDAKLTLFVWGLVDQVEGRQLQLTNADKSRSFIGIYMHENKLYIIEGTVPPGYPEPGLFQQSLGWLDENGVGLRYTSYYSNGFPPPPRVNRAGRGQGQGRIDAPGADPGRGKQ